MVSNNLIPFSRSEQYKKNLSREQKELIFYDDPRSLNNEEIQYHLLEGIAKTTSPQFLDEALKLYTVIGEGNTLHFIEKGIRIGYTVGKNHCPKLLAYVNKDQDVSKKSFEVNGKKVVIYSKKPKEESKSVMFSNDILSLKTTLEETVKDTEEVENEEVPISALGEKAYNNLNNYLYGS